jgi:hypothetical protein
MQIRSHKNPVGYLVRPFFRIWLDMRSLENRQRLLACNGTTTRVFIQNHDTKTSLAKPWPDGEILAVPAANRLSVVMIRLGHLREEWLSLLEKPQSFTPRQNLKTFP